MLQASSYTAGLLSALLHHGDVTLAFSSLISGIDGGSACLKIHSNAFPGGRVRTFFTPSAVPEPASWALMLGGLALAATAVRRRG